MRILAIDWGDVRLGLALSDPSATIATPMKPIVRKSPRRDIEEIKKIVESQSVSEIVVGVPLDQNGEYGKSALAAKEFSESVQAVFEGAIHLVDERYSTHAAERTLLEADLSRGRRKMLRDGVAAAWILQGFLDKRKMETEKK